MARVSARVKARRYESGNVVWTLSGTVGGVRIRKVYPSRAAADDALERLYREHTPRERQVHPRVTWMSEAQLRAAEMATAELPPGVCLLDLVRHHNRVSAVVRRVPVEDVIAEYITAKMREGLAPRTVGKYDGILTGWRNATSAVETVADVTLSDLEPFIMSPPAAETRRTRRKVLGGFLTWCIRRHYAERDPLASMGQIKEDRGLPAILTVEQASALLHAARTVDDGQMLGYFLLTTWSGLRPHEARQITREDVHLDPGLRCVEVSPRIAKVRQCRRVALTPALCHLLADIPDPGRFDRETFRRVRDAASLRDCWEYDITRHSFASYHYALLTDARALVYAMGNSEPVLFQRYIRPVTLAAAKAFFALLDDEHAA